MRKSNYLSRLLMLVSLLLLFSCISVSETTGSWPGSHMTIPSNQTIINQIVNSTTDLAVSTQSDHQPISFYSNVYSLFSSFFSPARRQLRGSNCILIQRGILPPYYNCIGCVIETALECLSDLRYNKSGNVPPNCKMNAVREAPTSSTCCPVINKRHPTELNYLGSAYPVALQCIRDVRESACLSLPF